MADIQAIFRDFTQKTALILGDVMIDSYIWGKVDRISPEAPVPIVHVQKREKRLGGAANVAMNIKALGAKPLLCSLIGSDDEGADFIRLMDKEGLLVSGIILDAARTTTIKHRVLSGSQHMLRIDTETDTPISGVSLASYLACIETLLPEADVVIFEDYDKGVLTPEVIAYVIDAAKKRGIPTVVDPKKRNFLAYRQCTLFKPNLKELREGLKVEIDLAEPASLQQAMRQLFEVLQMDMGMVTLSEHGILIANTANFHHIEAHKREIADVSGAGDTVVSIAALCLAAGLPMELIAALANLGGGLVCEYLGVVPIQRENLFREAIRLYGNG